MSYQNPIINLHIIQSFPASLLNRDENSNAKAITIGNVRRDRASSQSFRRAMRLSLREQLQHGDSNNAEWGVRTNRLPRLVVSRLVRDHGRGEAEATTAVAHAFAAMKLSLNDKHPDQTSAQLYIAASAEETLSKLIEQNFSALHDGDNPQKIDPKLSESLIRALDPGRAVDIALFGRFLSEVAVNKRVDGAVGVSHAFGVTPATVEMDFWTAVDDVQEATDTASSNLGMADLTAPLFYRHIFIDLRQLEANLDGTGLDATDVAKQFLKIAATASPKAKQTGTAANTLPSLVVATAGAGNYSAADAFTTPIVSNGALSEASKRLVERVSAFEQFGVQDRVIAMPACPEAREAVADALPSVGSIDQIIDELVR